MATISYYDNVKDDVKDKDDTGKPNFETLRKAAEEHSDDEEEQEGDGTSIEILEDGLKNKDQVQQKKTQQQQEQKTNEAKSRETQTSSDNPLTSSNDSGSEIDTSGLEQKLDRIIEQNQKMIEILESFGS